MSVKYFKPVTGAAVFVLALGLLFSPVMAVECGDINGSGQINVLDITALIGYLYQGGPPPVDPAMADVNYSGSIDMLDITHLIGFLYQQGPPPICTGVNHAETQDGCLDLMDGGNYQEYVIFQVIGHDLSIYHFNAYENCGLEYVVYYVIEGNTIAAYEGDVGPPADCLCYFNLKTTLFDLAEGVYTVCLIKINGDTLDCAEIEIGGAGMIDYSVGPCHDTDLSYTLTEEITYNCYGDTLQMDHIDAYFNCAANLMIGFEQAGDTLRFFEINVSEDAAYCMCYYNLSAMVIGIGPGTYIAEIWQRDYPGNGTILYDRREVICE